MAVHSSLPRVGADGDLSRYLAEVHKFPMLDRDTEIMLAERWAKYQDPDAAHRLVTSHLRLVAKVAMTYRGYGLPMSDLLSEGNYGMMQAIKLFDPGRGVRLATYALWWIRSTIKEFILRSWSLVRVGTTATQKKLFFSLRKLKGQLRTVDHDELPADFVTSIANRLDVPEGEVVSMDQRLSSRDYSLNVPMRDDGDDEWQDRLVDSEDSQEQKLGDSELLGLRRELLRGALMNLDEREREIFTARRLLAVPETLAVLGRKHKVSGERVRQIEVSAFKKLRESISQAVSDKRLSDGRAAVSGGACTMYGLSGSMEMTL